MRNQDKDADYLEYLLTKNCPVRPSQHLLSLYPLVSWIRSINELKKITNSVESLVIQGGVGKKETTFKLSNLSSLKSVSVGYNAFRDCHRIIFESMNDTVNDK